MLKRHGQSNRLAQMTDNELVTLAASEQGKAFSAAILADTRLSTLHPFQQAMEAARLANRLQRFAAHFYAATSNKSAERVAETELNNE